VKANASAKVGYLEASSVEESCKAILNYFKSIIITTFQGLFYI
jgi:hypothetical protein